MNDSDASLTRTERRRRATHEDFLAAVRTLLVESGVTAVTARRAAKLADHASATFYSHFETVDDAIREAVAPTADWARCWADTIASSDDFAGAVADWIADFLVRIEVDGSEWEVVRAANRPLLTSEDFDEIAKRMVERHGDRFATRGVAPGRAGEIALYLMAQAGDLHGGVALRQGEAIRIARSLHAVHWNDKEAICAGAQRSVSLWRQRRALDEGRATA